LNNLRLVGLYDDEHVKFKFSNTSVELFINEQLNAGYELLDFQFQDDKYFIHMGLPSPKLKNITEITLLILEKWAEALE